MTDVTTAATIASLREQVDRLTDYNQRLLAENVQLSNRQSMDREEIESMGKRNDELREHLANARKWIDGQDVRSDFPNATAMRAALDRERERSEGLDDDRSHMTLRFNEEALAHFNTLKELERERERCGVLEREVKAWHAAEHLRKDEWHAEFGELVEARWNTARTHALDAAKFGGA